MKKVIYVTIAAYVAICLTMQSCKKDSKDESSNLQVNEVTNNTLLQADSVNLPDPDSLNMIAQKVSDEAKTHANKLKSASYSYYSDWSGTVQICIAKNEKYGQHNKVDVVVDPGYVLIGGGARVTVNGNEQDGTGALLWASYPDMDMSTWHAASKDHKYACSHTLTGYAIGLKLSGLSRAQLKQYINYNSNTSSVSAYPTLTHSATIGYTLIGGGAKVNWNEKSAGNLLTESYPLGNSWVGKSKEHIYTCACSITVTAIGIKTTIPGFGDLAIEVEPQGCSSDYGYRIIQRAPQASDYVLACVGALSHCDYGIGRLLTAMYPSDNMNVRALSKDHCFYDSNDLYVYGIYIMKKK